MPRDRRGRARGADRVTLTLQAYADRGVFRGFSVKRTASGRCQYAFTWLTRRPMTVGFDPATSALSFRRLFPKVGSGTPLAADLRGLVSGRTARDLPSHKRLDTRRATMTSSLRNGDWSFTARVVGAHHEYATRAAINLVNELFLLLQDRYPDYLVRQFGFSEE